MILVGFLFVLAAIGLLIAGLAQGNPDLIWASIAASAVAGLAVAVAAMQRGRALRSAEPADKFGAARSVAARPASTVATAAASVGPQTPLPVAPADVDTAEPVQQQVQDEPIEEEAPQDEAIEDEALDPVDEPGEEAVDMADLLLVRDLTDEVLVVDLRPRYHMAVCGHLDGREAVPLPVNEAREDGFTPCGLCRPDSALATAARRTRSFYR